MNRRLVLVSVIVVLALLITTISTYAQGFTPQVAQSCHNRLFFINSTGHPVNLHWVQPGVATGSATIYPTGSWWMSPAELVPNYDTYVSYTILDPAGNTQGFFLPIPYNSCLNFTSQSASPPTSPPPTPALRPEFHSYCPDGPASALAVGDYGYTSTHSRVRIRILPGLDQPQSRLYTLPFGTDFIVIDGPVCVAGTTWWQIVGQQGTPYEFIGYAAETVIVERLLFRDTTQPALEVPLSEVSVLSYNAFQPKPTTLNVRQGPDVLEPRVSRLHNDTIVHVVGRDWGGYWYLVEDAFSGFDLGWVCAPLGYINFDPENITIAAATSHDCSSLTP